MFSYKVATVTLVAFLVTALDKSLMLYAFIALGLFDAVQAHASVMLGAIAHII